MDINESLTVRIPKNIAREVRKLKDDQDLNSYGLALQYWIEQQKDERVESQLIKLEETQRKGFKMRGDAILRLNRIVLPCLPVIFENTMQIQGKDSKDGKKMRKLLKKFIQEGEKITGKRKEHHIK